MSIRRLASGPIGLALSTGLWCSLPGTGYAQIRLDQPSAAFPQAFGAIQTVRELPDGRVLVADPLEKALYLVDLQAEVRTTIGREGQGPEEYRQPDAVWPLQGDSTLLVDLGNGRLVALGPDLRFGPTFPIAVGEPRLGEPLVVAIPQGVDGDGRVYARSMGSGLGSGTFPDSADILRIDRSTGLSEAVAKFKIQAVTRRTTGGAGNQNVAISPIPLSPEDAWGIARNGSVIIARSGDYHLERVAPDGTVTRGPSVSYEEISVGTDEKEEYLADQGRVGGGISVGVEVVDGQMSMSFARGGAGTTARAIDQYTWPETKPAFYGGRIPVDPENRAWVRQHTKAGAPSTYDVFDEAGTRVGRVTLETGKRIVGFGREALYVVAYDEVDLSYLERYPVPRF